MAFKVKNFMFLAIILAVIYIKATSATITKTSNFESYGSILPKLTVMNDRLRLLHAVWGEIQVNGTENVDSIRIFYDNILVNTKTAVLAAEIEEAAELAAEVRNVLVTVNGRLLATTLNSNNSQTIVVVQNYRTQLLSKYSVELTSAIFEQAIDAAFPFRPTDSLHAELNAIDVYPANVNTYKLRVNWNLYLYYKFLQRGDINDKYVYEAALALRNLKYSTFYNTLPSDSSRRIDAAFATFPSSLSTLFNSTTVCLENVNMVNYFLYFAESTASSATTQVPAVIRNRFESKSNDRLVWSNSFADRTIVTPTVMTLRLKSNYWYLYRQQGTNPLLVQSSDYSPSMRNWTPSLMSNNIMFEQLGFYMCATPQFDATLLGFSVKSMAGIKPEDTNCQWILTDCSRI